MGFTHVSGWTFTVLYLERWKCFVNWDIFSYWIWIVYVFLLSYIYPFKTQERQRFNYATFVNMQTRCVCVCIFLFSVYGDRFLKKNSHENPYMKGEGLNCLCVPLCLEIYVWKRHLQQTFFKEEIVVYVVPGDKSLKGFLWTAFILLNSKYKLTSAYNLGLIRFVVHYIESHIYITSPYDSLWLSKFTAPSNQNRAIWLTFKAKGLTN